MAELERYVGANSDVSWAKAYDRMKVISTELI